MSAIKLRGQRRLGRLFRSDRLKDVILFGIFGSGNQGNEASLDSAQAQVRRVSPTAHVVVACPQPETVTVSFGLPAMPIVPARSMLDALPRWMRRALRPPVEIGRWVVVASRVRRTAGVIVAGTGVLDDYGQKPTDLPYHLFGWSLMSWLVRRPFHLVSVGAGPMAHPMSARFARAAVALATTCTYRDEGSRLFMQSIGRNVSHDRVVPDLVFCLDISNVATAQIRPARAAQRGEQCIGIGVMHYVSWDGRGVYARRAGDYLPKLARYARGLIDEGYTIRILTGAPEDDAAVEQFLDLLELSEANGRGHGPVSFCNPQTFHDLVAEIRQTDLVVATRYHNVVGALMAERPAISLGYAEKEIPGGRTDKNRDVLKLVGLDIYCQTVEGFDVEQLLTDTSEVLSQADELNSRIRAIIPELSSQSAEQFELLDLPLP